MYGSTAKLPSVVMNAPAGRPLRTATAPRPVRCTSGSPHRMSAITGRARTAALHAGCCADSAVGAWGGTIPVHPR
ncbi:hypothetical protein A6E92_28435 [Streptomyces sp. S8]|nr:hypothetical protein A6E92_28435 [Streptomyces sp. S8]